MVGSQTLQLLQQTSQLNRLMSHYLAQQLINRGYRAISPSLLEFLSVLECGVNIGSDIARKLSVSRQMVAKTVKQLCQSGYLQQTEGQGKQKHILFTESGEHLMSDARQLLADMDQLLLNDQASDHLNNLSHQLAGMITTLKRVNE